MGYAGDTQPQHPLVTIASEFQGNSDTRQTGAASAPAAATGRLPFPARIGRYRVLGWLGSGGMGEVLAGHDEKLDRPVAIKHVRADLVANEERRRRLETEARLNARLSHPNVVQVFDFVSSDGSDHIISEYVDGESLAAMCRQSPPTLSRALDHLCAVARGLDAAHRQGIVHRDLKLENVLVGRDGQTKIADFGIATLRDLELPPSGERGTAATMSPEQRVGLREDERSDLYALGVMAYELLAGVSPRAQHRPLEEIAPAIPAELSKLVDRLLEQEKELRPASAREVEQALQAIAARVEAPATATAQPTVQLRQVAALALHVPAPAGGIEQLAAHIAEWNRRVREVAARYQAHLVWPSGLDALLCVGFPRVYGDNCAAAANLAAELAAKGVLGPDVRFAAGIDVGKVAVLDQPGGPVVAGPAIEGATDAARHAPRGAIHVTPAAQRTLSRSFRLAPVESGTNDRRVLYRLEEPLDWEARGAMVSSPFVGREDILALLRSSEARAFGGESTEKNVLVVGPPGCGKSRVVRAFLTETTAARILFVRGTEQARSTAFAAFARLVHDLPELRDDGAISRRAIERTVAELSSGDREMVAVVAQMAGVQDADDERLLAHAASYERHSFVANHLARFIADVLSPDPTLLVVEDAFWMDTSSIDVLGILGERTRKQKLAILCTSRPAPLLRHLSPDVFRRFELGPLSNADAARLADAAVRGWVLPPRVARAVIDRAAGIPLLIEELTQFVAARAAVGSDGTTAIDLGSIPTTFADAILERFHDLGTQTRRIALLAASIGNEIEESLLVAVTSVPTEELRSHIEVLSREGLLHGTGFGGRHVYAFRHALTRDAIYDAQDATTRLENHRAILAKIDALFPQWEAERPEILAPQCEAAGDLARAVRARLAAGNRAVLARSPAVAGQHFEAALQLLARVPATESVAATELEIRTSYAPVLAALMNWASHEVNANNARIRELAETSPEPLDWSTTFFSLTEDFSKGATDMLSAKLGWLAAKFDDASPLAAVNRYLLESMSGVLSVHAGYLVRAREQLERALAMREPIMPILRSFPVPEPMLLPRAYLAWIDLLEGKIAAAWTQQTTEEAGHEPGTLAYVTACSWGAPLAMIAHDWAGARWRTDVVLASDLPAIHHHSLGELHRALLDLREKSAEKDLAAGVVKEHVDAAWRGFARWRGDPPTMRVCVPLYLSYLAEGCLDVAARHRGTEAGAYALAKAREFIDEMLVLTAENNILDRYVVSEVYRQHAVLLELEGGREAERVRKEARARARALELPEGCTPLLEARVSSREARDSESAIAAS